MRARWVVYTTGKGPPAPNLSSTNLLRSFLTRSKWNPVFVLHVCLQKSNQTWSQVWFIVGKESTTFIVVYLAVKYLNRLRVHYYWTIVGGGQREVICRSLRYRSLTGAVAPSVWIQVSVHSFINRNSWKVQHVNHDIRNHPKKNAGTYL